MEEAKLRKDRKPLHLARLGGVSEACEVLVHLMFLPVDDSGKSITAWMT